VVLLLITACVRNVAVIALLTGYRSLTHRPTGMESKVCDERPLSDRYKVITLRVSKLPSGIRSQVAKMKRPPAGSCRSHFVLPDHSRKSILTDDSLAAMNSKVQTSKGMAH